jgi:uncharacterized protein YjiS (DUF1127 family)
MATVTAIGREGFLGQAGLLPVREAWIRIATAAARVSMMLAAWHERACQRRQLLSLGDAALKDFAASRAEADFEGGKPFWRS